MTKPPAKVFWTYNAEALIKVILSKHCAVCTWPRDSHRQPVPSASWQCHWPPHVPLEEGKQLDHLAKEDTISLVQ